MRQRPFGRLRTRVSEIGLGCWQLGGADWGDVSDEQALDTLRAAADAGVTFFDTADVYGLGRSESLIGRFLSEHKAAHAKEHLFVATKLGRFPQPGWPENFSAGAMRAHTEASLKRLGVELRVAPRPLIDSTGMSGNYADSRNRTRTNGRLGLAGGRYVSCCGKVGLCRWEGRPAML